MPPIHCLAFSRALVSNSRLMPATVPAAPFTSLARSSKKRFSLCMMLCPSVRRRDGRRQKSYLGLESGFAKAFRARIEAADLIGEVGGEGKPATIGQGWEERRGGK